MYIPPPAETPVSLQEEGARCKASLQAFTSSVIARLALSASNAGQLLTRDSATRDGNVYFHFPFCFREAFPGVTLEHLRALALSGALWMSYMRVQDDTIDCFTAGDPAMLFLRDIYLRESLSLLYGIFPYESGFWTFYSAYFDEYARSVLAEKSERLSAASRYLDDDFHRIAKGKAAMAKYPVAAQAVLSGRLRVLPILEESLDSFHVGYQYWDDLVDWKEDLGNANYSLLLATAIQHLAPDQRDLPDVALREAIGRVVYYSGLAEEHLERSCTWFERAYELSLAAGCAAWGTHVKRLQTQTVELARDLRAIMAAEE
jgi:hypothetical protein